jgi:hypothetical protein
MVPPGRVTFLFAFRLNGKSVDFRRIGSVVLASVLRAQSNFWSAPRSERGAVLVKILGGGRSLWRCGG